MFSRAALTIGLAAVLLIAPTAAFAEGGTPVAEALEASTTPVAEATTPVAEGDTPVAEALEAWAPTDGDWTETESFDTDGSRGDCTEGHVTRWANDLGDQTGMVWAKCGDAATAAALLRATWWDNGMFPTAEATPAFGDGLELVSPYPNFDGLNRLWTQGEWFITVARSCPIEDPAGCSAATATYAQELAALVGLPVDPVAAVDRIPGDYFAAWSPADANGWYLSDASTALDGDLERCQDGAFTSWRGLDGGTLEVFWVRCDSADVAFQIQHERWQGLTDSVGLTNVFGVTYDKASRFGTDVHGVTRSWVQGDLYVNVQRTCPNGDLEVCARSTAGYAAELAPLLPGTIVEDTNLAQATVEAGWLVVVVPLVTYLLLVVPQRIYFWLRSRGYSIAVGEGSTAERNFTAVDSLVRRVQVGRVLRRVILTVAVILVWFFTVIPSAALGTVLQFLYVFLSPFAYFALFGFLLRLVWRPHRLITLARRRGRPTPLGVAGRVIRLIAASLAGLALVIYFLATFMLIADRDFTAETVQQQIATGLTLDPLSVAWAGVRATVHALDATGTYFFVFLVMLVVPVTLAYLLDRFGQRLTRRSLTATLAVDDRPYFLYLRGFDEDRLRIDESVGRRGFLELFTPFTRPRFEEVLVEYLTQYGPVIAIAGSKQVISDLGAAKVSLGNDEWRDKVREWSAGARAVVMSATPREVRAGLEWEMEHVAANAHGVRIMLVLSPWKREEVARRWAGFLKRAVELPLFRPLVERPMPSGVEVMTYAPGRGWRGYGSKRRWDWSYAASIISAMENGDFDTVDPQ